MYRKILRKDFKRKKTMNIIFLIFVIMASTFVSASANNLISVTNAVDKFIDAAMDSDILIGRVSDGKDEDMENFLDNNEYVKNYSISNMVTIAENNLINESGEHLSLDSQNYICGIGDSEQTFFDSDDNIISKINDGEIYLSYYDMTNNNLKSGDRITIEFGDLNREFTIKDSFKDAIMGSSMMGMKRMLVSENDYNDIIKNTDSNGFSYELNLYLITVYDAQAFQNDYIETGISNVAYMDRAMIKTSYIMDTIISIILMVVSIFLIVIALVILRFTIVFTLEEEFREIGIMKAIGIKNRRIRTLYLIKYFVVAVFGSILGFFLSIPMSSLLIKDASHNIVMTNNENSLLIKIFSTLLIIAIVSLLGYFYTGKVKRFSPIDAIRNGTTGERFKRKSVLSLRHSGFLPTPAFLALNDILSGIKKFGIMILIFTLGVILIIVPANTVSTLNDGSILTMLSMAPCDGAIVSSSSENDAYRKEGTRQALEDELERIEKVLADNGMNAEVFAETMFRFNIFYKDNSTSSMSCQGTNVTADKYSYTDGTAPCLENEVALTQITADKIGAKIGDTVSIDIEGEKKDFIVTAIYQTMMQMGEGIRFSEKTELNYSDFSGYLYPQFKFTDEITQQQKNDYYEKIQELFHDSEVYSESEYAARLIGGVADSIDQVGNMIFLVVIGINILIAVLMVKSFITREKGEIGMLKSLGFKNRTLILWQSLRISIVLIISTIIGILLSTPIAHLTAAKAFEIMGATELEFVVDPIRIYLIYPMILLALTTAFSILSALQVRKISANETNNIE